MCECNKTSVDRYGWSLSDYETQRTIEELMETLRREWDQRAIDDLMKENGAE